MSLTANPAEPQPLLLRTEGAGGCTTLTLNAPGKLNALSGAMLDALDAALGQLAQHAACRVIVLRGAGRAFCAGHDLAEMMAMDEFAQHRELFARCSRLMLKIQQQPQPVIACVEGAATAAGCQLVAACDLAYASDAARFAVSGINLGLFCATPAVALSRNVGRKAALEMLLTGEFISAQRAEQLGLINAAVPADALDALIEAKVAAISAKDSGALAEGKRLFYRQLETGSAAAYQMAGASMACGMQQAAAHDGIDGFLAAKTAPKAPRMT
ncbi:enoyl-CoA hydratase [Piscinibacterium candidicorallinum]|uniref:Enoyl-CoA hydratase domain-containing protein 3, mitochondrial n=1 Tax=Piscinibacterium candidicorallinum TaxID=1793872 RepID=A0ABV7GZR9_9BURK